MKSAHAVAVGILVFGPIIASAQGTVQVRDATPATRELPAEPSYDYEYKDATFQLRLLPDSACCVEVEYEGLKGYLGVQPDGTPSMPYRYTLDEDAVTADGVTVGSASGAASTALTGPIDNQLIVDNLHALLDRLLLRHAEEEARKEFNRARAYEALRDGVQALASAREPE